MTEERKPVEVRREAAPAGTRFEAWAPLVSLREEIDRLFEDFGPGFWRHPFGRRSPSAEEMPVGLRLSPPLEVTEGNGGYRITAELPGLSPEEVEIRVADGTLTIRGEKTAETREEKDDYIFSERRYGAFHRSLALPAGADPDAITAQLANGVLTVTMPKSAESRSKERKIEVKAA